MSAELCWHWGSLDLNCYYYQRIVWEPPQYICLLRENFTNKRKRQPIGILGRSSGNHDWLIVNASACVSCGFRLRNARNASDCVWTETGLYAAITDYNDCYYIQPYVTKLTGQLSPRPQRKKWKKVDIHVISHSRRTDVTSTWPTTVAEVIRTSLDLENVTNSQISITSH